MRISIEPDNNNAAKADIARESICQAIRLSAYIALIPHVNADGDALGSALALKIILTKIGKTVDVYCPTPVAQAYWFLPGADKVKSADEALSIGRHYPAGEPFDIVIAVDAAACDRLGDCVVLFDHARNSAVIDHHSTNDGIAAINWVDEYASATGVMIHDLAKSLHVPLDRDIATCLYTSLSTDTGHFTQRNVNASALRAAADCLEIGIDGAELAERLHKSRTLNKTRLLSRALNSMTSLADGKLIAMCLTKSDFAQTATGDSDTEGLIDFGIAVQGSLVAMIATERRDGIKVSLRARPPINVAEIAAQFGGGGHALAAGCTLEPPLEQAIDRMYQAINKSLNSIII